MDGMGGGLREGGVASWVFIALRQRSSKMDMQKKQLNKSTSLLNRQVPFDQMKHLKIRCQIVWVAELIR